MEKLPEDISEKFRNPPSSQRRFASYDVYDDLCGIVIDNGSGSIKAGWAGDDYPRVVFPSVVGHSRGHRDNSYYVGDEAQSKRDILSLKYPIQRGIVTTYDWDDMEKIWNHAFENELRVKPEEQPVVMEESTFTMSTRKQMMEIMFEKFNIPAMCLASSSTLSLFATGRTTGVTVSIGESACSAVAVYDGDIIGPYASCQLNFGGHELTDRLARLLEQCGHSFASTAIVRDIKERQCYVQAFFGRKDDRKMAYELPDDTVISIPGWCRYMCPEALFQPSVLLSGGIHRITYNCISKLHTDDDLHQSLFSNIVLSGGSTMFPGLADRLQAELTALVPPTMKVKIVAPAERKYLAWIGVSILFGSSAFKTNCIYKQEYNEKGPSNLCKWTL